MYRIQFGSISRQNSEKDNDNVGLDEIITRLNTCRRCDIEFPNSVERYGHECHFHPPPDDIHQCYSCTITFPTAIELFQHYESSRIHNPRCPGGLPCTHEYPLWFKNEYALQLHYEQRNQHATYCALCGMTFSTRQDYNIHIQSTEIHRIIQKAIDYLDYKMPFQRSPLYGFVLPGEAQLITRNNADPDYLTNQRDKCEVWTKHLVEDPEYCWKLAGGDTESHLDEWEITPAPEEDDFFAPIKFPDMDEPWTNTLNCDKHWIKDKGVFDIPTPTAGERTYMMEPVDPGTFAPKQPSEKPLTMGRLMNPVPYSEYVRRHYGDMDALQQTDFQGLSGLYLRDQVDYGIQLRGMIMSDAGCRPTGRSKMPENMLGMSGFKQFYEERGRARIKRYIERGRATHPPLDSRSEGDLKRAIMADNRKYRKLLSGTRGTPEYRICQGEHQNYQNSVLPMEPRISFAPANHEEHLQYITYIGQTKEEAARTAPVILRHNGRARSVDAWIRTLKKAPPPVKLFPDRDQLRESLLDGNAPDWVEEVSETAEEMYLETQSCTDEFGITDGDYAKDSSYLIFFQSAYQQHRKSGTFRHRNPGNSVRDDSSRRGDSSSSSESSSNSDPSSDGDVDSGFQSEDFSSDARPDAHTGSRTPPHNPSSEPSDVSMPDVPEPDPRDYYPSPSAIREPEDGEELTPELKAMYLKSLDEMNQWEGGKRRNKLQPDGPRNHLATESIFPVVTHQARTKSGTAELEQVEEDYAELLSLFPYTGDDKLTLFEATDETRNSAIFRPLLPLVTSYDHDGEKYERFGQLIGRISDVPNFAIPFLQGTWSTAATVTAKPESRLPSERIWHWVKNDQEIADISRLAYHPVEPYRDDTATGTAESSSRRPSSGFQWSDDSEWERSGGETLITNDEEDGTAFLRSTLEKLGIKCKGVEEEKEKFGDAEEQGVDAQDDFLGKMDKLKLTGLDSSMTQLGVDKTEAKRAEMSCFESDKESDADNVVREEWRMKKLSMIRFGDM